MTVKLSNNFEQFVRELVESGRFSSEQEVIEAGVAKLMLETIDSSEEEIDDATAVEIQRAEEQIRQNQTRDFDEAVKQLRNKHFAK
jgi:putative addiction module CopG family antidote